MYMALMLRLQRHQQLFRALEDEPTVVAAGTSAWMRSQETPTARGCHCGGSSVARALRVCGAPAKHRAAFPGVSTGLTLAAFPRAPSRKKAPG